MKLKTVFTWDPKHIKVRLFRLLWQHGVVGDGSGGYSAKLSINIVPVLLGFEREYFGWRLTILGLQFHHLKAYGGIIV